jgi:hypothetical protein
MWLLPRLRFALAQRPWLYWIVVGICASLVWLQWSGAQAAAERARASWGESRPVMVAVDTREAGQELALERREYPSAMLPESAVASVSPAAVAARHVDAGAVLVPADVVDTHTVPLGWVVLAVPAQDSPSFSVGQAAAIFATGQRRCDGITAGITVDHVEVAVPPDCAAPLTGDLLAGGVVLARLP